MCDTFVALPNTTKDHSLIFGKNSDREPNEAQTLEHYPAIDHKQGEKLTCTYLSIPQVIHTNAILISRPFWMWGAEIGANEYGVVIGNEAVWTKMPIDKEPGLTGMDILRLALERSSDAQAALDVMIGLLHDYGQGGICGYMDKKMAYHNSFIIADPNQAWVFETAGSFWAAKKVVDLYTISNGLTIGQDFDEIHPGAIEFAQRKRWIKKGRSFNFAQCFSDWFYTTFSASGKRRFQSHCMLQDRKGSFSLTDSFALLRDHGGIGYSPDGHFLGDRICAHAGNHLSRKATQSTASLVAHLNGNNHTFWATASSAPCTGIFKPVWIGEGILPDINPNIAGSYDHHNYWWLHEKLHRQIIMDYDQRIKIIGGNRNQFERDLIEKVSNMTPGDKKAICHQSFTDSRLMTEEWINELNTTPVHKNPGLIYSRYWNAQNRKAGIQV